MRKIRIFALLIVTALLMAGCVSQEEHDAVISENKDLKAQVEQLKAEKETLTSEKEALGTEKATLETEKTALETEKTTLKTENDALAAEKEALNAAKESLTAENETLTAEVTELSGVIDSYTSSTLAKAAAGMGDSFQVAEVSENGYKVLIVWCTMSLEETENSYNIGQDLGTRVAAIMQQSWFDYDRTFVNFEVEGYGSVSSMEFTGNDVQTLRSQVWDVEE